MSINNRNIAIAISFLIVGAIIYFLRDIVTYVLIAWVISLLGQPLMRGFQKRLSFGKRQMPTSVCAILTLSVFILVVFIFISVFVPLVVEQASHLTELNTDKMTTALQEPINQLNSWGKRFGLLKSNENVLDVAEKSFRSWIKPFSVTNMFSNIIYMATNMIVGTISVLFISFFFLKEKTMFMSFLVSLLPENYEQNVQDSVDDTTTLLSRYISGLLLQMLFVIVFLTPILWIIGVQNAVLIAIFASIINIVPYLGPIMGCAFAVAVTITSNLGLDFYNAIVPMILKVMFAFGFMQFINDWIVQPLIFSNRVLAHPLEIFLVTLIGAKIGGIPGMILAIPSYTVLRVIGREFFNQFRFIQKITSSLDESDVLKD
jgi:predicted PurR-regulated permease PerM